ncbi:MAG: hypothetical protein QF475_00680 [Candidatus Undinarchaeales archaeon]|jgi:hypothetical protein|nr:hypothetical protein [Candidatus Undinarchaeales archaeon]
MTNLIIVHPEILVYPEKTKGLFGYEEELQKLVKEKNIKKIYLLVINEAGKIYVRVRRIMKALDVPDKNLIIAKHGFITSVEGRKGEKVRNLKILEEIMKDPVHIVTGAYFWKAVYKNNDGEDGAYGCLSRTLIDLIKYGRTHACKSKIIIVKDLVEENDSKYESKEQITLEHFANDYRHSYKEWKRIIVMENKLED